VHHPVIHHHCRAESVPDALVPQTDPQGRNPRSKRPQYIISKARTRAVSMGPAKSGGARSQRGQSAQRDLVIPEHAGLNLHLTQVLHEIVRERIIIIDDQNHKLPLE